MCTVLEDEKECQSVCLPGACSLVGLNCSNLLRGTIDKYIYIYIVESQVERSAMKQN